MCRHTPLVATVAFLIQNWSVSAQPPRPVSVATANHGSATSLAANLIVSEDRVPSPLTKEILNKDDVFLTTIEFDVNGKIRVPQGNNKGAELDWKAEGRFKFEERITTTAAGKPASIRYYERALVNSNIGERRNSFELDKPVRIIVAHWGAQPYFFSPAGALKIRELEMVRSQFDPMHLHYLLPNKEVKSGEQWPLPTQAAKSLFDLTDIVSNKLTVTLESRNETKAQLLLKGTLSGRDEAASTSFNVSGRMVFDVANRRVSGFAINLNENREPSHKEPGHVVSSSFRIQRVAVAQPQFLASKDIAKLPLEPNDATSQLAYEQPDGRFRLHFGREWMIYQSNPRQLTLRWVEGDELLAQCKVLEAPTVAAGNHMAPARFRAQVQQALGGMFRQFVDEGKVDADDGIWVYRLAAAGADQKNSYMWYYYLVASPDGRQLVFVFSMDAEKAERFGARDFALVSTIQFADVKTALKGSAPKK